MKFVGLHSVFIVKEVSATVDARYVVRMVVGVTIVVCQMSYFVGGGGMVLPYYDFISCS
jgi:hypothetical protein